MLVLEESYFSLLFLGVSLPFFQLVFFCLVVPFLFFALSIKINDGGFMPCNE